ncbi:GtrA family protein [Streptococcus suis]|nr:GtrA family protein [Streptococcus suis]
MKKRMNWEVINYLIFGVLTTVVYMIVRTLAFHMIGSGTISATIGNIAAIIFAFITNDTVVFKQPKTNKRHRFFKFLLGRAFTLFVDIVLAYLLVDKFQFIIGKFVHHNPELINTIEIIFSQMTIVVLNYIISKRYVFNN